MITHLPFLDLEQFSMNLSNMIYIITGSSGHLGSAIACSLSELGAELILVDHPSSDFESVELLLSSIPGSRYHVIHCDLSDEHSRFQFIDHVKTNYKSVSCLINNAAYVGSDSLIGWSVPFEEQSLSAWRSAFEVNVTAPFHLIQAFAPLMRNDPSASVLNISSIYGLLGPDWSLYEGTTMSNPAAYSASKGALIQLTRWLATTLAPSIRVNAIAPGGIKRGQPLSFQQKYVLRTPLKRMAEENDFLGTILFLTSSMSSYVTGQVIMVDGGWSAW